VYAIVKTGGKQYRVERGQSLLVERLRADDGATVALDPLLYVDGSEVVDGGDLSKVTVSARVLAHERGPKLRVVKFKPKRGYKRRTGHRQELTRIEVTEIKLGSGRSRAAKAPAEGESTTSQTPTPAPVMAPATKGPATKAPAAKPTARKPRATKPDAGATKPDAGATKPDASATKPDASATKPDASATSEEKNDGA
jgi:large subunit ribosomal protein L21